jgi:DNA-binding transcriptional regulator YhcF (GntR family)
VKSLLYRIASGEYPVGSTLPSCRSLGATLGLSHSTVNRAYQELEGLGVLRTEKGKGVVVQRRSAQVDLVDVMTEWDADLASFIQRAQLWGLTQTDIQERFMTVLAATAERKPVRVAFVECHTYDTRVIAEFLQQQLTDATVDPVDLDSLANHDIWSQYDLVSTTFYHLAEVEALMPPGAGNRVIGLHQAPSHDSILQIARLPRNTRVLVVAKNDRTCERLVKVVRMDGPDQVISCVITDQEQVESLTATCDVVICTHSSVNTIRRLTNSTSLISVDFHIQADSVAYLSQRVGAQLAETKENRAQ